jgi:hypothetical protein
MFFCPKKLILSDIGTIKNPVEFSDGNFAGFSILKTEVV